MKLRVLIALQLTVIVVFGVLTATQFGFFSPIDETGHLDYIRVIAEEHRLPVLAEDKMGYPILALAEGLDPDAHPAPQVKRPSGLSGESYQAFEAPLYYVLVAPTFVLTDDWSQRVKLVRLVGLAFLLATAALLYRFAGRVAPEAHLPVFSLALTVLMWPGVVVRSATVSNTPLEILMATAFLYVIWRVFEVRDERRLLLAGAVLGLALLTKITLIALAPLLVVAAVRHGLRGRDMRAWLVAAAATIVPLVLLTPWFIFNLHHYDAITASHLAKHMQEPVVNPNHITYTLGRFLNQVPQMFSGLLPQDWATVVAQAPVMAFAFDFLKVMVFGLPVLLLIVEPRWLLTRHALLLLAPFVLGLAMVGWVTLAENWPIGTSRRLYAELPTLALFTGISCLQLFRSRRVAPALAATASLVLAASWVDLTSRFLL